MRALAVATLLVVLLAATVGTVKAREGLFITKCCREFEMLSGDGTKCVGAGWPQNVSIHRDGNYSRFIIPPLTEDWLWQWLPPGIPLESIGMVMLLNSSAEFEVYQHVVSVHSSSIWGVSHLTGRIWRHQAVFLKGGYVVRPGFTPRKAFYCVDAAQPPLGPFAMHLRSDCSKEECARKCCYRESVLVKDGADWVCQEDSRRYWSPHNSSFTGTTDPEFPFDVARCSRFHLAPPQHRSLRGARTPEYQLYFSTRKLCYDHRPHGNGTLQEDVFYCDHSRVARGVYWLLRPLCVVAALLLGASLLSIACDQSMRRKIHGWCLACHAASLFAFNIGQIVFYFSISDTLDSRRRNDIPAHLESVCRHFGE